MQRLFRFNEVKKYFKYFIKWMIFSVSIGIICGLIGVAFCKSINFATSYREQHPFVVFFLPLFGFAIVFLYKITGMETDGGTNRIFTSVRQSKVPKLIMAPLIFVSSFLTHLGGASAGREGAALQIGGSIAANMGKAIKLEQGELKIATVCGMSAVFSAIFGTPVTCAVFCLEVVNVGLFHFTALFPSIIASFTAHLISISFGITSVTHQIYYIPALSTNNILKVMVLGLGCALVSIIICRSMSFMHIVYDKYLRDSYTKILISSLIMITVSLVLNTTDYYGTGIDVINRAINGQADTFAFLIKIVLTAITLTAGFKGGEIVPSMFIGATFGCVFSQLIGLNSSFCAALGLIGVFCGAVNCPISSLIMSVEMFGGSNISYFAIICAISYFFSGSFSLYKAQKIVYPKINVMNDYKKY